MYQIRVKHNGNKKTYIEEGTYEVVAGSDSSIVLILGYLEDDPGVAKYGIVDMNDLKNLTHKHFGIVPSEYPKFKNYK